MEISITFGYHTVFDCEVDRIMSMLSELLKNLFKKRATILYPEERDKVHVPEGYRGKLEFYREKCIGCTLCYQVCPSYTIEIITDEKGKRPVFNLARCTYCGQCEDICPTKSIHLTKQFEVISLDKKDLVVK